MCTRNNNARLFVLLQQGLIQGPPAEKEKLSIQPSRDARSVIIISGEQGARQAH